MTRAYCTRCGAERDSYAGRCAVGHRIAVDAPGYVGKHRARVAVPRLQVLEVLGFSDHGASATTTATRPRVHARPRIPSTPRRSSRPVGRHRYGASSKPTRSAEITNLSLAAVDTEPTENTGVLVERLWEASHDTMAQIETWHAPTSVANADPGHRRWPWVMAAVSIAAAALALWALPNAAQNREQEALDTINAAVANAGADLDNAAVVSSVIIDPSADPATLSGMAVDLTRIDTAARVLLDQAVAAEEANLSNADEIGQAGELALSLERRLSTVLTYRLLIESSLSLPELPATATPEELGDVARLLSEAVTSIRTDVESLPRDELLDAHRAATLANVEEIDSDQTLYLSALRDGDGDTARAVGIAMQERLTAIHDGLDELLVSLEPWVTDTVAAIESNLAR